MMEKYGVGAKHVTNEGCEIEIVEKLKKDRRRVRFEDGYEVEVYIRTILSGAIKNPYLPSVFGVGYLGVGYYICSLKRKITPEYNVWTSMLRRCYDKKFQEKHPTYKGITVSNDWLNFQNFAKWCEENYPKIESVKFDLDKDLLQQDVEDKIYSPDTCVFLPYNVNNFLANKCSNNTSGYIGVNWDKSSKKLEARIKLFGEEKIKHLGRFHTSEEASFAYQSARAEQAGKVKDYIRSLNYLPEHIIQLIK